MHYGAVSTCYEVNVEDPNRKCRNSKNADDGNFNQVKASRTADCIHEQHFMESTSTWLRRSLLAWAKIIFVPCVGQK
jgi:hypothetical protein